MYKRMKSCSLVVWPIRLLALHPWHS